MQKNIPKRITNFGFYIVENEENKNPNLCHIADHHDSVSVSLQPCRRREWSSGSTAGGCWGSERNSCFYENVCKSYFASAVVKCCI